MIEEKQVVLLEEAGGRVKEKERGMMMRTSGLESVCLIKESRERGRCAWIKIKKIQK